MFKLVGALWLVLLDACAGIPANGVNTAGPITIIDVTIRDAAAETPEAAMVPGRTVLVENDTLSGVFHNKRVRLPRVS